MKHILSTCVFVNTLTHTCRKRRSQALGDLDTLFGDELASINSMVEEFHTQDKEAQQRKAKEEQELQEMESKTKEVMQKQEATCEHHLQFLRAALKDL